MSEDEPFLRAILAAPNDMRLRLVYADWLEDRNDLRGEYLRLDVQLEEMSSDHTTLLDVRRRMADLRPKLPPTWLVFLGDHRSTGSDPDLRRVERVASLLGRPVGYTDEEGYNRLIVAAVAQELTNVIAYVECRSKQRDAYLDIKFHLHVRDQSGQEVSWEVETYNPYFGCDVRFLEWYMDAVLVIYREKHRTYVCRFGVNAPAEFKPIADDWVLDGRQLGYRGYQETGVRRLRVPDLKELSPLSSDEAALWELLPAKRW